MQNTREIYSNLKPVCRWNFRYDDVANIHWGFLRSYYIIKQIILRLFLLSSKDFPFDNFCCLLKANPDSFSVLSSWEFFAKMFTHAVNFNIIA